MRIGILSTVGGYKWAGTEEVWYHFAKLALAEGHQLSLAADHQIAESDQASELASLGLKICCRKPFRPARAYLLKERLWSDMRHLRRQRPDVVLVNAGSPSDVIHLPYLARFLETLDCPKVFFCHFNSDRLTFINRAQLIQFLASQKALVFVNRANQLLLQRQLAYEHPNTRVILNAPRLVLEHPLPFPEGSNVIHTLNLARLETQWKGQDILIELLGRENWDQYRLSLKLYGGGPDQAYLQDLIRCWNLADRIELAGYERDLVKIFSDAHLLLMPSRGEGTPLAILEAMMCGRPVVASDVGGISEILEDGITGFIAEAPTQRSFGRAMERAFACRDRWPEMGEAAHHRAKELADSNPPQLLLNLVLESVHSNNRKA